ncbi:unnamed protein product [[Candida] boidinii]|nr:unnamed protein product [[Candida] boidinii]
MIVIKNTIKASAEYLTEFEEPAFAEVAGAEEAEVVGVSSPRLAVVAPLPVLDEDPAEDLSEEAGVEVELLEEELFEVELLEEERVEVELLEEERVEVDDDEEEPEDLRDDVLELPVFEPDGISSVSENEPDSSSKVTS